MRLNPTLVKALKWYCNKEHCAEFEEDVDLVCAAVDWWVNEIMDRIEEAQGQLESDADRSDVVYLLEKILLDFDPR